MFGQFQRGSPEIAARPGIQYWSRCFQTLPKQGFTPLSKPETWVPHDCGQLLPWQKSHNAPMQVLGEHIRVHGFLHKSQALNFPVVFKRALMVSLVDWICRLACIPDTAADACRHACPRSDTCTCRLSIRACPANLFTYPRLGEETFQQTSMPYQNTWRAPHSRIAHACVDFSCCNGRGLTAGPACLGFLVLIGMTLVSASLATDTCIASASCSN